MPARPQSYRRARQLRTALSLPETLLWQHLRQRAEGVKFRRQHPVGPYVADFYVAAAKLVIEIDGAGHRTAGRGVRDEARDQWCEREGYAVLRVPAADVLADPSGVADAMVRLAAARVAARRNKQIED